MKITFLGTGCAIPTLEKNNTSFLIQSEENILVDCPPCVYEKIIEYLGEDSLPDKIVITHSHVDHITGLPSLLEIMRLKKWQKRLDIYISGGAFDIVLEMLKLHKVINREECFPIKLHSIPMKKDQLVFSTEEFKVFSNPVIHSVPNIALKFVEEDAKACYSSDTERCEDLDTFAYGCDVLIHEAAYLLKNKKKLPGHSSVDDSAICSLESGVKKLYIVHVTETVIKDMDAFSKEVIDSGYQGEYSVPEDGETIEI